MFTQFAPNETLGELKVKDIKAILGGDIQKGNSKMPGYTFSQATYACNVGSKLAAKQGTVCHSCYAKTIEKMRPSVAKGYKSRTEAVQACAGDIRQRGLWVEAFIQRLTNMLKKHSSEAVFRWHDSGDIQGRYHLEMIVEVARRMPWVKFWIPTKEVGVVRSWLMDNGQFPENLMVRVSSPNIGQKPLENVGGLTSTVTRKGQEPFGHLCPAMKQDHTCGDCRACWDRSIANITYPLHK